MILETTDINISAVAMALVGVLLLALSTYLELSKDDQSKIMSYLEPTLFAIGFVFVLSGVAEL